MRLHACAISTVGLLLGSMSFALLSPITILNTENLQEVSLPFCSHGLVCLKLLVYALGLLNI